MPMGSKFRFFIPPHLGYGERQVSAVIGANSTLIFDVELISFK
jgi:FKBP-type peptidyl-prolyl cis-trans isomerase FklB